MDFMKVMCLISWASYLWITVEYCTSCPSCWGRGSSQTAVSKISFFQSFFGHSLNFVCYTSQFYSLFSFWNSLTLDTESYYNSLTKWFSEFSGIHLHIVTRLCTSCLVIALWKSKNLHKIFIWVTCAILNLLTFRINIHWMTQVFLMNIELHPKSLNCLGRIHN